MLRLSLLWLTACQPPGEAPQPDDTEQTDPSEGPLREVALFQAVEIPLFAEGAPIEPASRNAPIIAGRPGVVRALVDLPDDAGPTDVELVVDIDARTFRAAGVLTPGAAEDADRSLVVEIPADALLPGATCAVRLLADGAELDRFPAAGSADLSVMETGPLKVRLVPFEVQGWTPDTSASVVEGLRMALFATWPVTEVEISVAPVEVWGGAPDLGDINVRVGELQERAMFAGDVSWDTYYYGLVTGVATREEYDGITGTSEDGGGGELVRAYFAAGAAFADQRAEDTLIHEMGHVHGLLHTACDGEDNTDPDYPHPDGTIGVEGWDLRTHTFVPADTKDMMSYCYPRWISDHGYRQIADHVANAQSYAGYQ